MVTKQFSTGLPALDQYVGGILPGNSLLLFSSDLLPAASILEPLARHARAENIPVAYLSFNGSLRGLLAHSARYAEWQYSPSMKTAEAALNSMKRFLGSQRDGSLILTDDCSVWNELFRHEKHAIAFMAELARITERKHGMFCATLLRSRFSQGALSALKELPTICLDMVLHGDDVYALPLSLRGRYVLHTAFPCRFGIKELHRPAPDAATGPEGLASMVREASEIFQSAFQGAPEALLLFSLEEDLRELNRPAEQLLGYAREELLTLAPSAIVAPHHWYRMRRFLVELRSKKKRSVRLDLRKKNGRVFPVEFSAAPVGPGRYVGILRDDSERTQSELDLRRSGLEAHSLMESSGLAVAVVARGKVLFANAAFGRLFAISEGGTAQDALLKRFFTPVSVQKIQKAAALEPGTLSSLELEGSRADGTTVVCRASAATVEFRGRSALQISCIDLSREHASQSALAEAYGRYRAAVESSALPVALLSGDAVRSMNGAFLSLFGLDATEPGADVPLSALLVEADVLRLREALLRQASGKKGALAPFDALGKMKDGTALDLRLTLQIVRGDGGEGGGGALLFAENRSAQKQKERGLSQQQRDLDLLKEIISSSTGTLDLDRLLRIGLDKITEVLHWDMGAVYLLDETRKEFHLNIHHHFPEALAAGLAVLPLDTGLGGFAAKTQEPHLLRLDHYPSYLPHRALFRDQHIARVCLLPLIAHERPVGLLITAARKEVALDDHSVDLLLALSRQLGNALANALAFRRLKQDEEQYQLLVESSPDVMYTALPNGSFLFISPQVKQLTGYAPQDFYRSPTLWLSLIHADDKKIVLGRTTRLEEAGEKIVTEYRLLPKGKASPKWLRDELSLKRDATGAVSAMTGVVTDVTRSREIVDQLDARSKRDTAIFSSLTEGVLVFGPQLRVAVWNRALEAITGYTEYEMLERTPDEVPLIAALEEALPKLNRALAGEVVVVEQLAFRAKAGQSESTATIRFAPLRESGGAVTGVVGVVIETTGATEAAGNSRATEAVLMNVIDTMDDILIITDLKGTIIQVNKSFLRVLGYARSEAIGFEFPYSWLIEEEMGRFVLWIANLRERNWLHDFDMTWRAKDGRLIPMSLSTTLLRNSLGEPIAMLNIARDITERTRLARDLETRSKQVEMINRIISKANQTVDFDEIFSTVTEEIQKFLQADTITIGLLSDDAAALQIYALGGIDSLRKGDLIPIEQTVSQFAIRSQKPAVIDDLLLNPQYSSLISLSRGLRSQISLPILLKGKPLGTLNIGSREPHSFNEEHGQMLLPLAQQIGAIIDRIQLVTRVTEDSLYIRNLLDSIDSIVYTVDSRFRLLEVNKAFGEFMRECGAAPVAEYQGLGLFDVLPSEPLKIMFRKVVDQLLAGSVRIFSEEFTQQAGGVERIYQLTINPLAIGGRITGLVFTHTDITALKITELELKQSNEQLLALNEVSTLISTSFDLQDILKAAIPLLQRMLGATAVLVYLIEKPSLDLYLAEQIGLDIEKSKSIIRLKHSTSATGSVIKTREPLYIQEKAFADERIIPQNREVLRENRIESMAVIPLVSKDKVLGALDIFYAAPHEFFQQEQQMLALIGNQLGSTIENAQLYSELRSQIDRLTVLYELSQKLTSTLEAGQIFQSVYESVSQIVPFERFFIELYDLPSKSMTATFLVETVLEEKRVVPQASQPHSVGAGSPAALVLEQMRPFQTYDKRTMYIPMVSKETLIGIMSIHSSWAEEYAESHLRLLESIGNLTAIALEKAQLYEETLQKSEEIHRRNKELDDFTYVVSHDLKEPLISIEGFSRILQMDYQEVIQQEGKEYLESIVGATTRMKGLIDDLLMLSRVSRPSESFRPVPIKEIVEDIKTDMEFTIRQKGVKIIVDADLPDVVGNATQITMVFRNLIGNAIKFNNAPNPEVEIGFRNAENNSYLFFIRDNGIGIDPDFHEKIFVIFQRLHRREDYEGSGAGLAIVKKIIEIHKGTIWVESRIGEGSTFFFTIPKIAEA